MFTVVAIDDNENILNSISELITCSFGGCCKIETFTEISGLITSITRRKPDIAIVDIILGDESGIKVACKLKELFGDIKLIFITSFKEYVPDIFRAKPSGLIYKPFDVDNFNSTLNRVLDEIQAERNNSLLVKYKSATVKIHSSELVYIESSGRKLVFRTNNNSFITYSKISEYTPLLPDNFCRPHQSYFINIDYIDTIENTEIHMTTGEKIPISKSRAKEFKDYYFNYIERESYVI